MAEKYPDAYVINPIRSLYDSGKINTQKFLMNCGSLNSDRSTNRQDFIQTNSIYIAEWTKKFKMGISPLTIVRIKS